ncbi:MAG: hypothetical protein NTX29_08970, partial [Actinobacteria bacterium]|nr:hypothetical protein [Actinomycetota bacterium]
GGGGGGFGGGGSGAVQMYGGSGGYYGGGGGGGSTGPAFSSFAASTNGGGNGVAGGSGQVTITIGTADPAPSWFQAYARPASASCDPGWSSSWAQWPGDGAGGFVCNREIYQTITGEWSSRSVARAIFVPPAHPATSRLIHYRC